MAWKTRAEWDARPDRGLSDLPTAVGCAYHWEGPGQGVYSQAAVPGKVRSVQNYHMDTQGWADIAYSFVFDRYGDIWEARGWNHRTAANGTNAGNSGFLAFCYLGGEGDEFTPAAQRAAAELYAAHVARGGLAVATCHHDHTSTACPGGDIHNWIVGGGPAGGSFAPAEEIDMQPDERAALMAVAGAIGNPRAISGQDATAYEAFLRFITDTEKRISKLVAGGQAEVAHLELGLGMCASAIASLNTRLEGIQMNPAPSGPVALTQGDLDAIAKKVAQELQQRLAN